MAQSDSQAPFNVGYDMNHESQATKDYTTRNAQILAFRVQSGWFSFRLEQGLTQTNSGANVGQWGQYDQSRIDILKYYADRVWETTPGAYLIMEHFADNSEEPYSPTMA